MGACKRHCHRKGGLVCVAACVVGRKPPVPWDTWIGEGHYISLAAEAILDRRSSDEGHQRARLHMVAVQYLLGPS